MIHARGTVKTKASLAWLALVVVSVLPTLVAAEITARLQHGEIPVDRSTRLLVSLSGTSSGKPELPTVPGLRFTPSGTSSQMQFVNGQMSSAVTYTFHVQASKTGDFTIPPITANINGKVASSQPVKLRVVKALGNASQPPQARQRGARPTPGGATSASVTKEAAFLELETQKGQLYMGEMIPVAINAYFRDGLGVSVAPPQLEGDAFVLHNLGEEPEKSRVQAADGIYTKLTWNGAISAIKEGRYPIKAKLAATIQVPVQRSRRRRPFDDDFFGGSVFNDDFFNQFFGGGVEEKQVSLTTQLRRIRVQPLPEKGRPEDFSGAVGQFKLSVSAKPTTAQVGDPITLKMTISGSGNFDRVTAPSLVDGTGWKTYEPSDTFKASGSSGFRGRKRFEQAIVPESAAIRAIPPVRFSYFNTRSKKYATLDTKPIAIALTGVSNPTAVAGPVPETNGTPPVPGDGFVPIHLEVGRRASLAPLATQPWFLALQTLPLGSLMIGLLLYRRHSKTMASPEWVQKKESHRQVQESLRDTGLAVQQGDSAGFIAASQRAIRAQLADSWQLRADAITLAELNTRLPEDFVGIRRVFEAADALAYSGQSVPAEDMKEWHQQVLSELDTLTQQQAREGR